MDDIYIAIDIGGTKMRVAAATDTEVETVKKIPTPKQAKDAVPALTALIREAAGGRNIRSIAGGMPGVIYDGTIIWEPKHLVGWQDLRLADELAREFNVPVRFMNDVAVVGLGETHEGAGKGSHICAYITVSTGVNGARFVDGVVDPTTYGFEIGCQLVNGEPIENLISGLAISTKFGIEPKDLESIEERNKLADILAIGLYNATLYWSPDTIVVGGSMIVGKNPIPLARAEETLHKYVVMFPAPKVVMAALSDEGGVRGAAILARQIARE
jgi:glucokinase